MKKCKICGKELDPLEACFCEPKEQKEARERATAEYANNLLARVKEDELLKRINGRTFWIAGRFNVENLPNGNWEVLGLFDSENKAVEACSLWCDFVASLKLNEKLPEEATDWVGLYYPLQPNVDWEAFQNIVDDGVEGVLNSESDIDWHKGIVKATKQGVKD